MLYGAGPIQNFVPSSRWQLKSTEIVVQLDREPGTGRAPPVAGPRSSRSATEYLSGLLWVGPALEWVVGALTTLARVDDEVVHVVQRL